jgi:hypothetical protein
MPKAVADATRELNHAFTRPASNIFNNDIQQQIVNRRAYAYDYLLGTCGEESCLRIGINASIIACL